MKINELISRLSKIQNTAGNIEIVFRNYKHLGDTYFMLENESLVVRDNILYIE